MEGVELQNKPPSVQPSMAKTRHFGKTFKKVGIRVLVNSIFLFWAVDRVLKRNLVIEESYELVDNILYKLGLKANEEEYGLKLEVKRKLFNLKYLQTAFVFYKFKHGLFEYNLSSDGKDYFNSLEYNFKDGHYFRDEKWLRCFFFENDQVITYNMASQFNQTVLKVVEDKPNFKS